MAACAASTPSPELVNAREEYSRVQSAPSTQLALDSLYEAQKALKAAEEAHEDDPNSYEEKSLAYVAERKAQLALAKGGFAQAIQLKEQSEERLVQQQDMMLDATRKDAAQTRDQVEQAQAELRQQSQELQKTQAELQAERQRAEAAQARADAAFRSLEDVAKVKAEAETITLSLDGSVLFLTGKSSLLPAAHNALDRVAETVNDLGTDSKLKVIGYTDSRGSEENNQQLSEARARSVADYLSSHGISRDRLEVVGMGEANPVATNDTPEGRANNRRVEIVVERTKKMGSTSDMSQGNMNGQSQGNTNNQGTTNQGQMQPNAGQQGSSQQRTQ
jgi:outer membrane protein OmpA-like peptidoglycan-associated protein